MKISAEQHKFLFFSLRRRFKSFVLLFGEINTAKCLMDVVLQQLHANVVEET